MSTIARRSSDLILIAALLLSSRADAQSGAPPQGPGSPARETAPPLSPPGAPTHSWFWRPPLEFKVGEGDLRWTLQVYGFAELDMIRDSTRAYAEGSGATLIPRDTTQGGTNSRLQLSGRNSRLGFRVTSPVFSGMKTTGLLETDFMGTNGSNAAYSSTGALSEASFYNNGTLRLRAAYIKVEHDVVNVLAGATYNLFGAPVYFFPASVEFFPWVGMAFYRTTQLRLWHSFQSDPVNVDLAVAALRPPNRDSGLPAGEANVLIKINNWKALHTPGAGGTAADPAAVAFSAAVRRFKVDPFVAGAPQAPMVQATGWGLAADVLLPIVPVKNSDDRSNALTLTAEVTVGTGYADLIGGGNPAGIGNPPLPNPMMLTPAPTYTANFDSGTVVFTPDGVLHTIDWLTYMAGLQYYLPGGRFFVAVNYDHSESKNVVDLVGGEMSARAKTVVKRHDYGDVSLFFDLTPNVRLGALGQINYQTYADNVRVNNKRFWGAFYYFF